MPAGGQGKKLFLCLAADQGRYSGQMSGALIVLWQGLSAASQKNIGVDQQVGRDEKSHDL